MGKELLLKVLSHEKTERLPWVPFAGVHAGLLKGYTAIEVLKDEDKLYESLIEVNKLYAPDGMPIMFDLQIEAEILGCELQWAEKSPPSVSGHPLEKDKKIPCDCEIPKADSGRIPMVTNVMKRVKESIGEEVALYGLICGPLTLASHLRGSSVFMDMLRDPQYAKDLFEFCTKVNLAMADYYLDAGMDIIAIVDPLISQISPKHFDDLLADDFITIFDYIRSKNSISSFFVCGDATRQIEVMCKTNPDYISVDENVNLITAKEITDKYNIVIGGNIPLTTTMLFGNQQDNMKYVLDLIDNISHNNLIISPGCDMPYGIPPENTIAVEQAIKEPDAVREMLVNYEASDDDFDDINVELPDYDNLPKPLVEVFTLDSTMCAACTYMLKAAEEAVDEFGDLVDVVEYRYTIKEDVARIKKVGVEKLPSMYINGELKWSSIIPDREEYFDELRRLLK